MSNLRAFPYGPLAPDVILELAQGEGLQDCLILGHGPDGEFWFGGSVDQARDIFWLLERARMRLHSILGDDHAT